MLISLAWKNVWRNKKRSLIVITAISFGLWGGLLAGAVMMGWGESMVETAIDRDLAHIQIHKKNYTKNKEVKNFIPAGAEIINQASSVYGVKGASARTLVYGMAASPASSYGVKIIGVNPEQEKNVTTISQYIIGGNYFKEARKNQIVVGKKLAKRLNLKLRSKVVISFEGLNGEIVYIACRVRGIFKTESALFDEMNVFVNQNDLFRNLGTEPVYHEIAIRAESAKIVKEVYENLKSKYTHLEVATWNETAPEIAFLSELMKNFSYLFVAIIVFALLFGITNTMLMSVVDRVHEFGVLIAVGMKKRKIFLMILLETIFLSITGGVAGTITGGATIGILNINGLNLTALAVSMESFGSSTILYPYLPAAMYIVLAIMIVLASNVAAIMPAWKAIHLQPSEAIRTY